MIVACIRTIPRSYHISTKNGWKSDLLKKVNCINPNLLWLKQLLPIQHDLKLQVTWFKTHFNYYCFFFLAYGNNTNKSQTSENFYCEVCDRKFNGPIPYDVHLNSKAHKEEVAIREEFNDQ